MPSDERKRQVIIGLLMVASVAGLFLLVVMGTSLPGVAGEFFTKILGIITTPFLMEASVIVLGFLMVFAINYWRRLRDGDELVYLDEIKDPPKDIPDQAR